MINPESKLWQKCKFDKDGNELSYEDNTGLFYSIDENLSLIYYKDNSFEISQNDIDMLSTKSIDKHEQLFVDILSKCRLQLEVRGTSSSVIFFLYKNKIIFEYNARHKKSFWICKFAFANMLQYNFNNCAYDLSLIKYFIQKFFKISADFHII